MDLNVDSPIAALASPPGGAMRGIVRVSGQRVRDVLSGWFHPNDEHRWRATRVAACHSGYLTLDATDDPINCPVDVYFWPNQKSYTGQPLLELHLPGSSILLETVLGEVYRRGVRVARPGEFTLRAFLAGKLDLLQAEAVLGVIDARNETELQTALTQLSGGVSGRLAELRRDLLELLADLEAGLDFVDEDIEFISRNEIVERLSAAQSFVTDLLQQTSSRMLSDVREKVVLAGLPNAGKSTLFNLLTGRPSAIVSNVQGTTRDYLVHTVEVQGLSFALIDTAGWESTSNGIAASAQDQRTEQVQNADLLIWCTPEDLDSSRCEKDEALFRATCDQGKSVIRVFTKSDLRSSIDIKRTRLDEHANPTNRQNDLRISAVTEDGLEALRTAITSILSDHKSGGGQWMGMTAARCRETLESIATSLTQALTTARIATDGDELIAVDLRGALDHLGLILGVIYTDDILDRIFSKFCIGK